MVEWERKTGGSEACGCGIPPSERSHLVEHGTALHHEVAGARWAGSCAAQKRTVLGFFFPHVRKRNVNSTEQRLIGKGALSPYRGIGDDLVGDLGGGLAAAHAWWMGEWFLGEHTGPRQLHTRALSYAQ